MAQPDVPAWISGSRIRRLPGNRIYPNVPFLRDMDGEDDAIAEALRSQGLVDIAIRPNAAAMPVQLTHVSAEAISAAADHHLVAVATQRQHLRDALSTEVRDSTPHRIASEYWRARSLIRGYEHILQLTEGLGWPLNVSLVESYRLIGILGNPGFEHYRGFHAQVPEPDFDPLTDDALRNGSILKSPTMDLLEENVREAEQLLAASWIGQDLELFLQSFEYPKIPMDVQLQARWQKLKLWALPEPGRFEDQPVEAERRWRFKHEAPAVREWALRQLAEVRDLLTPELVAAYQSLDDLLINHHMERRLREAARIVRDAELETRVQGAAQSAESDERFFAWSHIDNEHVIMRVRELGMNAAARALKQWDRHRRVKEAKTDAFDRGVPIVYLSPAEIRAIAVDQAHIADDLRASVTLTNLQDQITALRHGVASTEVHDLIYEYLDSIPGMRHDSAVEYLQSVMRSRREFGRAVLKDRAKFDSQATSVMRQYPAYTKAFADAHVSARLIDAPKMLQEEYQRIAPRMDLYPDGTENVIGILVAVSETLRVRDADARELLQTLRDAGNSMTAESDLLVAAARMEDAWQTVLESPEGQLVVSLMRDRGELDVPTALVHWEPFIGLDGINVPVRAVLPDHGEIGV